MKDAPTCGCQARLGVVEREALRAVAVAKPAKAGGRITVDRAALHRVLGGRDELREALDAKATGRPGVNVARIWSFMTTSVYQSGDLPILAAREALQNAVDAVKAAVRARKTVAGEGRFAVSWDAERRALTFEDNGIGMDAATILGKFLSLGESGKSDAGSSDDAAGGFGVAKAVILGTSSTFRWELHTRDNLAVSSGADADVQIFDAPFLQGARITVFDVPERFDRMWDRPRQEYVGLVDRLRELLAANDLPGVTLVLDGEEVRPMFSRRGGAKVAVEGAWGAGTTATVKAYRRPPGDRGGAYYQRLGGLYQFRMPAQRGNLKADVVVDLVTRVRPGQAGYPFNAARDALQDAARWALSDLVDEVERENESAGRSQEDEVFDPDSDSADERAGAEQLGELAADAFRDAAFQKALAQAAGGIVDFYAERAKDPGVEAPTASLAPTGTKARSAEETPERGPVLPAGFAVAASPIESDIASPTTRQLRSILEAADGATGVVLTARVLDALDKADAGQLDGWGVTALSDAIDRAADAAMSTGGGGLVVAATIAARGNDAIDAVTPTWVKPQAAPVRRNPFGKLAGLRISKKNYDRRRAARFRKAFARWIPHLTAWDATLRLVATEARIRKRFKPGFVLDDELLGLTTSAASGSTIIYLHPDRFEQVIKAHRDRPLAIAAYLHGVACHELTHADGRMGKGHSEEFVAAREDLGHATAHLLPAIAVLAQRVLDLPMKPSDDQRRIARLERELDRARSAAKSGKRASAEVERCQAALDVARADLVEAERRSGEVRAECGGSCRCAVQTEAERVLNRVVAAVRSAPPVGFTATDVEAFAGRHRGQLVGVVDAALAKSMRTNSGS